MQYRDLDIFFRKDESTNDIRFVSNNSSIVQSIKNLVLTKNNERPFNVVFGTSVLDLLFNSPSLADIAFLQLDIADLLTRSEPRIKVDSVEINYPYTGIDADNEQVSDIKINISYYLNTKEQNPKKQEIVLTVNQL